WSTACGLLARACGVFAGTAAVGRRLRARIDLAFGDGGELGVGRLLFLQVLAQDLCALALAELVGPGHQGAVARDLVVLDRLSKRDNGSVQDVLVLDLAHDVFGLADDSIDGRTFVALGLLALHFEYALEP